MNCKWMPKKDISCTEIRSITLKPITFYIIIYELSVIIMAANDRAGMLRQSQLITLGHNEKPAGINMNILQGNPGSNHKARWLCIKIPSISMIHSSSTFIKKHILPIHKIFKTANFGKHF